MRCATSSIASVPMPVPRRSLRAQTPPISPAWRTCPRQRIGRTQTPACPTIVRPSRTTRRFSTFAWLYSSGAKSKRSPSVLRSVMKTSLRSLRSWGSSLGLQGPTDSPPPIAVSLTLIRRARCSGANRRPRPVRRFHAGGVSPARWVAREDRADCALLCARAQTDLSVLHEDEAFRLVSLAPLRWRAEACVRRPRVRPRAAAIRSASATPPRRAA